MKLLLYETLTYYGNLPLCDAMLRDVYIVLCRALLYSSINETSIQIALIGF